MDLMPLVFASMNAAATMIVAVMFVTGPLSLMVELAWRATGR